MLLLVLMKEKKLKMFTQAVKTYGSGIQQFCTTALSLHHGGNRNASLCVVHVWSSCSALLIWRNLERI